VDEFKYGNNYEHTPKKGPRDKPLKARDTHEKCRATIAKLKESLAREQESGDIANKQWNEWMAKARELEKERDELLRQHEMHLLDVKDWQLCLYSLENEVASMKKDSKSFWKLIADKNQRYFNQEFDRAEKLEEEQRDTAELLSRIAGALGHPLDDPLRLAEARMEELVELDHTILVLLAERDELRKMLREACPVEPQCDCVTCSEEREYWMSSLRNTCKEQD